MTKRAVTIDGKSYDAETLSSEIKQKIGNLRVVDREIARLRTQLAIAQTARNAYAQALKGQLEKA